MHWLTNSEEQLPTGVESLEGPSDASAVGRNLWELDDFFHSGSCGGIHPGSSTSFVFEVSGSGYPWKQ